MTSSLPLLHEFHPDQLATAGSKLRRFRSLLQLGCNLPPSYVLDPSWLAQVATANHLVIKLQRILQQVEWSIPASVSAANQQFKLEITSQTLPSHLLNQLAMTLDLQLTRFWAVRSSVHNPEHPFTGSTHLNVVGVSNVWDSITQLWAHQFSADKLPAQANHVLRGSTVPLWLFLQPMIEVDCSGVAYSADAEHTHSVGSYHTTILSSWGHTRRQTTDWDIMYVSDLTGQVTTTIINPKPTTFEPKIDGYDQLSVDTSLHNQPSISERVAEQLGQLVLRIRHHLKRPVQVWWGWDGDQLWVLEVAEQLKSTQPDHQLQTRFISGHNLPYRILSTQPHYAADGVVHRYRDWQSNPTSVEWLYLNHTSTSDLLTNQRSCLEQLVKTSPHHIIVTMPDDYLDWLLWVDWISKPSNSTSKWWLRATNTNHADWISQSRSLWSGVRIELDTIDQNWHEPLIQLNLPIQFATQRPHTSHWYRLNPGVQSIEVPSSFVGTVRAEVYDHLHRYLEQQSG